MKDNRIFGLNSMLKSLKDEFFSLNTPKTTSNEVASIYHYLTLERDELIELSSNEFLSLESRFAVMNKHREFKTLLKIGKYVFVDSYSNEFNLDIDFNKESVRRCIHFLIDASYSAQDYHNCIFYGEKLFTEIENNSNSSLDTVRKNVLMALSMAYCKISQYEKSDYYSYLANKKPESKIDSEIKNYKTDDTNELFLLRGIIDNIKLGSKIEEVIHILGKAEKRSDRESKFGLPQSTYLKYYSRGIELLFNDGILTNIWVKSGINYGNDEDEKRFTKYNFSADSNINLDSKIEDIEAIYGKASEEHLMEQKIPYKIYLYKGFAIITLINSGDIATIRLMIK